MSYRFRFLMGEVGWGSHPERNVPWEGSAAPPRLAICAQMLSISIRIWVLFFYRWVIDSIETMHCYSFQTPLND